MTRSFCFEEYNIQHFIIVIKYVVWIFVSDHSSVSYRNFCNLTLFCLVIKLSHYIQSVVPLCWQVWLLNAANFNIAIQWLLDLKATYFFWHYVLEPDHIYHWIYWFSSLNCVKLIFESTWNLRKWEQKNLWKYIPRQKNEKIEI